MTDPTKPTSAEVMAARMATAMKSPQHLREWLEQTDRRWLVFNAVDLVESLPWPDGVDALVQIVASYRDHRSLIDSGRFHDIEVTNHLGTEIKRVPIGKDDTLEVEELDRAIRYLTAQLVAKKPDWKIEDPSL